MAIKLLDQMLGGRFVQGSATYDITEIMFRGEVLWPQNFVYVIDTSSIVGHYTGGAGYILANGSNYRYYTATVYRQVNGTTVETLTDRTLTVNYILDSSSQESEDFYVSSGTNIRCSHQWYDESEETLGFAYVSYGNSAVVSAGVVVRQANRITSTVIGEKTYGSPYNDYEHGLYEVTLSANQYDSWAGSAPASGGTATLSYTARHYRYNVTITPWVRNATYTYTSGASKTEEYDSGGDKSYTGGEYVTDTPTITGGTAGFTLTGTTVDIASAGQTVYSSGRAATFTATNGDATASVNLYQEPNLHIRTDYSYNISCSIDYVGDFPAEAGIYGVDYTAKRTPTEVYTSGSYLGAETDITCTVTGVNCTPEPVTVSGTGELTITTDDNYSAMRTVSVQVAYDNDHYASDSRSQSYSVVAYANVFPTVAANGSVSLQWRVQSGSPSYPVTVSGVTYHYILSGSSTENTVSIGSVQVSQDSDGVLLNWRGFPSGASGTHWLTGTSPASVNITFSSATYFDVPTDIDPNS